MPRPPFREPGWVHLEDELKQWGVGVIGSSGGWPFPNKFDLLVDPPPQSQGMTTTLFHPIDPWGYFGDRGKDQNNFPGDGINSHQSTREWTSASAQEAEASSSLAPAKPVIKENNIQIEGPSRPVPSSSRGGYDRIENVKGKEQCLSAICKALGVPPEADDLLTIRRVIELLGGMVPQDVGLPSGLTKAQRRSGKAAHRRRCFEVLRDLACPLMRRIRELLVLKKVLEMVTSEPQASNGGPLEIVFRAW